MKKKKIAIPIIIISAIVLTILFVGGMIFFAIMSVDKNCVIEEDYSYITLNEEKYIPLNSYDELLNKQGTYKLIGEAKVKGTPDALKVLFGDSIYAFSDKEYKDIIYLQTDYDSPPSKYYCKESAYKRISKFLEEQKDD
jgi:hypothetical protein